MAMREVFLKRDFEKRNEIAMYTDINEIEVK